VESAYILEYGKEYFMTLSPQQIASCTPTCDGCGGGWTTDAYEYLSTVTGLASSWFWPYDQSLVPSGSCLSKSCTQSCSSHNLNLLTTEAFYVGEHAAVSGFSYSTPPCSDACEKQNVAKLAASLEHGPISILVNAGAWDDYQGGVMTVEGCGGMAYYDLDHGVQLVGFNTTAPKPYWIVRNSWSTDWGMDGYIYLEYGKNTCGLADVATVPTIPSSGSDSTEHKMHMFKQATMHTSESQVVV